jgi:hypothetical protein
MATDTPETFREELRYEIPGDQTVSIAVDPIDHRALPQVLTAHLINLSASGAKLAVAAHLPPHKMLRLKLQIPSLSLELYVSAKVCWASHSEPDQCILGVRLSPRISESLLGHLAAGGRLDRREATRVADTVQLHFVRDRRLPGAVERATVQNYSAGGMCLETTTPARIGERIQVRFSDAAQTAIVAVVRWQLQQGNCCLLGCGYVEADGFEKLTSLWPESRPAEGNKS